MTYTIDNFENEEQFNEFKMYKLKTVAEALRIELGLDVVQIIACAQNEKEHCTYYSSGSGLLPARIQITREFIQKEDAPVGGPNPFISL